jgi:hypothetical protein
VTPDALLVLNLLLTFGVFSAVCWRLRHTGSPSRCVYDRGQWALWGAVHIGIAWAMLVVMFDSADGGTPAGVKPHIMVAKGCLLLLFLVPWRRRMGDRA